MTRSTMFLMLRRFHEITVYSFLSVWFNHFVAKVFFFLLFAPFKVDVNAGTSEKGIMQNFKQSKD